MDADRPNGLWMPWTDSPLLPEELERCGADEATKELARRFHEDGYVVLEGAVPPELVDAIVADYPRLFDPNASFRVRRGKPSMLTHDPSRRQDAWTESAPVRELACLPSVLDLLRFLYGRGPIPFQTLNFRPGTQQAAHSDSIHFDSLPAGFMCGVWVALEDTTEDNGPLLYYPGSHRLPRIRLEDLGVWAHRGSRAASPEYERYEQYVRDVVRARGLREQRLIVKRGTALVWSSNLLHGGSPVRDPNTTRLSQVTHYYFEDCVYYSPILSDTSFGELRLKTIFDLRTDEIVPHRLNGRDLDVIRMKGGRVRLGRPETFTWAWLRSAARQRIAGRLQRFCRKRGWEGLARRAGKLGHERDVFED